MPEPDMLILSHDPDRYRGIFFACNKALQLQRNKTPG